MEGVNKSLVRNKPEVRTECVGVYEWHAWLREERMLQRGEGERAGVWEELGHSGEPPPCWLSLPVCLSSRGACVCSQASEAGERREQC